MLCDRPPGFWRFLGTDLMPVVADAAAHPDNPTAAVQDSILFTYDDAGIYATEAAVAGNPDLDVEADTSYTVDARPATELVGTAVFAIL